METCERSDIQNSQCFCVSCKQGKLSKEQYTEQIRKLCSTSRTTRVKSNSFGSNAQKSNEKTNNNAQNQQEHDIEKAVLDHGGLMPSKYFIDEEEPNDLQSYNSMVNGKVDDPRILPAVVDTVKYLRKMYREMLIDMKPKSSSFFERERAKVGTKGSDSFSSDDLSSAESAMEKPAYLKHENARVRRRGENKSGSCTEFENNQSHWKLKWKVKEAEEWLEEIDGVDNDSGVHFGYDAVEKKEMQKSRLHFAAKNGNLEKVVELILDCCDVNEEGENGWPAIESALNSSKFRCALFLIEAGTDMKMYTEKKVNEYETVLRKARSYTHFIQTAL